MLKLLQIGKHFAPDSGGVETVTEALADGLLDADIRADVLCMGLSGRRYEPEARAYRVDRHPPAVQLGNKTISFGYVAAVRRAAATDYAAALLHLPNPLGIAAALAFWRKPLLLLWHADVPQPRLRQLLSPLDRRIIRRAAAVIVPTPVHASGSYLADAIGPKAMVAPYPFDRRRLAAPSSGSAAMAVIEAFLAGRRLVLAVGRLVDYKGFDRLVAAAATLPDDLAVVIVGTGALDGELHRQIAAAGLGGRVLLAGGLDNGDLSACFARATVFCLPSVTSAEMYGIVQVEALAAGVPIVSTAVPRSGVGWVNRDGISGLVVPPGDAGALSTAIGRIAGDCGLHARLSRGARTLFAEEHDMARAAARYADIIRGVVAPSGQRA